MNAKLSPTQQRALDAIRASGGPVYACHWGYRQRSGGSACVSYQSGGRLLHLTILWRTLLALRERGLLRSELMSRGSSPTSPGSPNVVYTSDLKFTLVEGSES
jgi:hypothetical protein